MTIMRISMHLPDNLECVMISATGNSIEQKSEVMVVKERKSLRVVGLSDYGFELSEGVYHR